MAARVHRLEVFADYHQFYVCDGAELADTSLIWSDDTVERMLAVAPGLVAVGTARNMTVPVVLELLDAAPAGDFAEWERVIDCGLAVPSGRVAVAGCTDYFPDCPRFDVAAGDYRARVSYAGLDSLSEDGLEGEDRYRIQLWPGTMDGVVVHKR